MCWKPHDRGKGTGNPRYERASRSLNGIGTGLALPIAGIKIALQFGVRKPLELHNAFHAALAVSSVCGKHNGCDHLVTTTLQTLEEFLGFGTISRFAEYPTAKRDGGIRHKDNLAFCPRHGHGLVAGHAFAVIAWQLTRAWRFINVRRSDFIGRHTQLRQYFKPSRTCGAQNEARMIAGHLKR